jgi:hypothetical protein
LGKIKAVFELTPLTTFCGENVPIEAVERSAMAMNTLQTFYATVEEKRNERQSLIHTIRHLKVDLYIHPDLDPSKWPASTPFHRTDVDTDRYKFLISTAPLFRDLPIPGKLPVRAMTMDDLKSVSKYQAYYSSSTYTNCILLESTTLPSPTKMQQLQADNSNLVEEVPEGEDAGTLLHKMHISRSTTFQFRQHPQHWSDA